jgi:hypothetical protein
MSIMLADDMFMHDTYLTKSDPAFSWRYRKFFYECKHKSRRFKTYAEAEKLINKFLKVFRMSRKAFMLRCAVVPPMPVPVP